MNWTKSVKTHAETAQKVLENRAKVLDKVLDDPNFERKSVRSQSSRKKEKVQKTSRFLDSQRMVRVTGVEPAASWTPFNLWLG